MTIDERRRRRTGDPVPDPIVIRPQRAPAPCGSRRAAQRHRDNGEEVCAMCRNAERMEIYRAAQRRQARRAAVA